MQQIVDTVVSPTSTEVIDGRSPLIEAIPVQGRSVVAIEREVETEPESSELLAERALRGNSKYGGGKRDTEARALRGNPGFGGGKRAVEERALRGNPGFGGGKRSLEENAVQDQ